MAGFPLASLSGSWFYAVSATWVTAPELKCVIIISNTHVLLFHMLLVKLLKKDHCNF